MAWTAFKKHMGIGWFKKSTDDFQVFHIVKHNIPPWVPYHIFISIARCLSKIPYCLPNIHLHFFAQNYNEIKDADGDEHCLKDEYQLCTFGDRFRHFQFAENLVWIIVSLGL